jgi:hypothetical protein
LSKARSHQSPTGSAWSMYAQIHGLGCKGGDVADECDAGSPGSGRASPYLRRDSPGPEAKGASRGTLPIVGVIVHLFISGRIGISYGLLFEHESPDFAAGLVWGLRGPRLAARQARCADPPKHRFRHSGFLQWTLECYFKSISLDRIEFPFDRDFHRTR